MRPFLEEIADRVLVCDGAMGTMLYTRGVFVNRCFEGLNVSQPDLVGEVHQAYLQAGADVIETNTFGANRVKLDAFGMAEELHAINLEGVRIARRAAGGRAYVAGAMGPLGIRIEPWGRIGVEEVAGHFREQAAALLEGGIDLFILETFRDLNEIRAAVAAVRGLCGLPIVAQMTTEEDGDSLDGTPPEVFAPELERLAVQVIGVNCGVGPAPMLETIERMARVTGAKLAAQPNAGKPREIEGRTIYLSTPEYMASYARRFVAKGVRLVGGCCGTTPEHIRQIKLAVQSALAGSGRARVAAGGTPDATPAVEEGTPPVPRADKSRMAHALARGKSVILVELLPPRGHDGSDTVERARALRIHGVDAVNIPDGPLASARMSALALAVLIEQQAGIETVLHYSCRDRSLLGMQSDLLGAHAMGVRNLLIVTGDPPKAGDYPAPRGVLDVDSIGLTNVVARLNQGIDIGGRPVGRPTAYHIGVALNPTAVDPDLELKRLEHKIDAGAEFAVTQATFDLGAFDAFMKRIGDMPIPVIVGLWPLHSLRSAEFLANEVPGVLVPQAVLDRMRRADGQGRAAEEGVAIAREIALELRPRVQGFQVSTPADRIESALAVIEGLI